MIHTLNVVVIVKFLVVEFVMVVLISVVVEITLIIIFFQDG